VVVSHLARLMFHQIEPRQNETLDSLSGRQVNMPITRDYDVHFLIRLSD